MSYFVLRVEDPDIGYRARLAYTRDYPLRSWMTGVRFDRPPPEPIVLTLRGTHEDDWSLGDLWLTPITVMSTRLYDALLKAGVHNLDTYAVELHDPENGNLYSDYLAFNIVGKISAADVRTQFAPESDAHEIAGDIDSLVVDTAKANGALIFRLAESVNAVIAHESVKNTLLAAGIDTLTFTEPENWAG